MVTVRELTKQLSMLKEELQDKDIVVVAKNDLLLPPEVVFNLYDPYHNQRLSNKNVVCVVLRA